MSLPCRWKDRTESPSLGVEHFELLLIGLIGPAGERRASPPAVPPPVPEFRFGLMASWMLVWFVFGFARIS